MTYHLAGIKIAPQEVNGTFEEALQRAREIDAEFQPAYGIDIEDDEGNHLANIDGEKTTIYMQDDD